jgi:hypothetical protein
MCFQEADELDQVHYRAQEAHVVSPHFPYPVLSDCLVSFLNVTVVRITRLARHHSVSSQASQ